MLILFDPKFLARVVDNVPQQDQDWLKPWVRVEPSSAFGYEKKRVVHNMKDTHLSWACSSDLERMLWWRQPSERRSIMIVI